MEILKIATEWAKTEIFSSTFFILFGMLFLLSSLGFWQFGKTDLAKSYIIPTLVAGILLFIVGTGLIYSNLSRTNSFPVVYKNDATAFVESEIDRTVNTLNEYKTIVFTSIPIIIAGCALLIIFFNTPIWRASLITTIAMLVIILLVDGNAGARIEKYQEKLLLINKKNIKQ